MQLSWEAAHRASEKVKTGIESWLALNVASPDEKASRLFTVVAQDFQRMSNETEQFYSYTFLSYF